MAVDGITFDKPAGYTKGDKITIIATDSGRAVVPAGADTVEEVAASMTLASGQIVNGVTTVTTPGTPAVPAKAPGAVTVSGGRTASLVAGSDTGTVAKYTTVA